MTFPRESFYAPQYARKPQLHFPRSSDGMHVKRGTKCLRQFKLGVPFDTSQHQRDLACMARDAWKEALSLDPSHESARINLGLQLIEVRAVCDACGVYVAKSTPCSFVSSFVSLRRCVGKPKRAQTEEIILHIID
jgi:hypothetical protein